MRYPYECDPSCIPMSHIIVVPVGLPQSDYVIRGEQRAIELATTFNTFLRKQEGDSSAVR